jgi:hypothetical protein
MGGGKIKGGPIAQHILAFNYGILVRGGQKEGKSRFRFAGSRNLSAGYFEFSDTGFIQGGTSYKHGGTLGFDTIQDHRGTQTIDTDIYRASRSLARQIDGFDADGMASLGQGQVVTEIDSGLPFFYMKGLSVDQNVADKVGIDNTTL